MVNFKEEIAKEIANSVNLNWTDLETYIEIPKNLDNGDYSFPVFKLAKELKKAPQIIANEIKQTIKINEDIIKKVDIVGGYLNFYINKDIITKQVLETIENNPKFINSQIGKGKTVLVEYSSPNIAKPFHIGHLKTTVIGGALYNIYKALGYNTVGINYLGDYGTQFGKLIEGYKLFGNEYDLTEDAIDKLADIYMRINNLCKEDESVLNNARENFKLLEQGDEYCVKLWKEFKELSLKEFQKIYDLLGSKFDFITGEAFFATKTEEVVDILKSKGKLVKSEGAMVVDLADKGIDTPCIILKSDGSTIYATRDLASILYRARTYNYDKSIYITSYEQNLHFKQIFEVAKLLGLDEKYTDGLEHVPYGFVRLPTGKMSTRLGNFVKVETLLNDTIEQAYKIIEEKNPDLEDKQEVAKKVGIGAVIFNDLATSRIKDEIFDINEILNFQGETGPYIQYIYVRTKSVLEKAGYIPKFEQINIKQILDEEAINVLKLIYNFTDVVINAANKNEPSILARYLIDLSQSFSTFYNEHHIITEHKEVQDARLYLTYVTGNILKRGAALLGIQMPERM